MATPERKTLSRDAAAPPARGDERSPAEPSNSSSLPSASHRASQLDLLKRLAEVVGGVKQPQSKLQHQTQMAYNTLLSVCAGASCLSLDHVVVAVCSLNLHTSPTSSLMRPRSVRVPSSVASYSSCVLQVVTRRLASYKYMLRESRLFDRANALDQLTQKLKRCATAFSCVPDRVGLVRCTNVALPLGQLSSKPSASSE